MRNKWRFKNYWKNETAALQSATTETTASAIQQDVSQPIEDFAEIILKTERFDISETEEPEEENEPKLQIEVNVYTLTAVLADNSSAQIFAVPSIIDFRVIKECSNEPHLDRISKYQQMFTCLWYNAEGSAWGSSDLPPIY